ncbi:hypothetical protein ALI22I_11005 [Saccharothrix sp. ALI-22-I]|nr:hypothetical protein ALI22I_11005 [Saccharothrix sp. ALI-22-I]
MPDPRAGIEQHPTAAGKLTGLDPDTANLVSLLGHGIDTRGLLLAFSLSGRTLGGGRLLRGAGADRGGARIGRVARTRLAAALAGVGAAGPSRPMGRCQVADRRLGNRGRPACGVPDRAQLGRSRGRREGGGSRRAAAPPAGRGQACRGTACGGDRRTVGAPADPDATPGPCP